MSTASQPCSAFPYAGRNPLFTSCDSVTMPDFSKGRCLCAKEGKNGLRQWPIGCRAGETLVDAIENGDGVNFIKTKDGKHYVDGEEVLLVDPKVQEGQEGGNVLGRVIVLGLGFLAAFFLLDYVLRGSNSFLSAAWRGIKKIFGGGKKPPGDGPDDTGSTGGGGDPNRERRLLEKARRKLEQGTSERVFVEAPAPNPVEQAAAAIVRAAAHAATAVFRPAPQPALAVRAGSWAPRIAWHKNVWQGRTGFFRR